MGNLALRRAFQPLDNISATAKLAACCSYGLVNVYIKRTFLGLSSLHMAIGQQIGALVLLLPFVVPMTVLGGAIPRPSIAVVLAVLGLALLSTALAYLLFFHLIATVGPMQTSLVTYLTPVFGVLWGAFILREPVRPGMLVGVLVILVSVGLTSGVRIWPIKPRASPVPTAES